jgi:heat shock protein HtpX
MKLFQMGKRVGLFLLVNVLVVLTLGIITKVFGLDQRLGQGHYQQLMAFCFIYGMGGAFISLALSRIMAKWAQGVRVLDPDTQNPTERAVIQMVYDSANKAGLEVMPEVGIYQSPDVNAFATGPTRARSLVAVSTGLLNAMDRREVAGVIAHEVAHIANGDMVTMTLLQGVVNAFAMFLARILAAVVTQAMQRREDGRGGGGFIYYLLVMLFEVVFMIFGTIVICWFSRWREFRADAGGAQLAGTASMIAALTALKELHPAAAEEAEGTPALQTLKISNRRGAWLFASHPPLGERIARLRAMA